MNALNPHFESPKEQVQQVLQHTLERWWLTDVFQNEVNAPHVAAAMAYVTAEAGHDLRSKEPTELFGRALKSAEYSFFRDMKAYDAATDSSDFEWLRSIMHAYAGFRFIDILGIGANEGGSKPSYVGTSRFFDALLGLPKSKMPMKARAVVAHEIVSYAETLIATSSQLAKADNPFKKVFSARRGTFTAYMFGKGKSSAAETLIAEFPFLESQLTKAHKDALLDLMGDRFVYDTEQVQLYTEDLVERFDKKGPLLRSEDDSRVREAILDGLAVLQTYEEDENAMAGKLHQVLSQTRSKAHEHSARNGVVTVAQIVSLANAIMHQKTNTPGKVVQLQPRITDLPQAVYEIYDWCLPQDEAEYEAWSQTPDGVEQITHMVAVYELVKTYAEYMRMSGNRSISRVAAFALASAASEQTLQRIIQQSGGRAKPFRRMAVHTPGKGIMS